MDDSDATTAVSPGSSTGRTVPASDHWPRTRRVGPWVLAVTITVIWLLPVQQIFLPAVLPLETKPDRVLILALVGAMVVAWIHRRQPSPPARVPPGLMIAFAVMLGVFVTSIVLNAPELAKNGSLTGSVRYAVQIFLYGALFWLTTTTIRPGEIRAFLTLILGLAVVAALGTVWEYRTGNNVFYDTATRLALGGFVLPPPVDLEGARANNVGPSAHGLAITTMLALAVPFALTLTDRTRRPGRHLLIIVALVGVFVAGGLATQRRTAIILPVVGVGVIAVLSSTARRRLVPLAASITFVVVVVAPTAATDTYRQLTGQEQEGVSSAAARSSDYAVVLPRIESRPLFGMGVGGFRGSDRIFDNEYLGLVVGTGFFGLLSYLGLLVALAAVGFQRRIRRRVPSTLGPSLVAAVASFAVASALFDILAFPQVPYVLMMLAALTVVEKSTFEES